MLRKLKRASLYKSGHWTIFLNYCNTLLNAKRGIEGSSSFQKVLAHNLAYWDPFPLQIALIKLFFLKLGFTPCKAEQSLQGMELQEKEAQKD